MRKAILTLTLLVCAPAALAQLTPEQKLADFRYLAGLYNKYYAPYEWKRTLFGHDLLNIAPWLDRVAKTKDDLDFYEVCVEYVAGLQDTHDAYGLPTTFSASLGFTVDIYGGKVLIDSITRSQLPADRFPAEIGDEVISVDGKDVEALIAEFSKYAAQSNPRSTRRTAAARIVSRPQSRMPHAPELGTSAEVVIRRQSGAVETYTLPWIKRGLPLEVGPVLSPRMKTARRLAGDGEDPPPDYMRDLLELQHSGVSDTDGVLNYGARSPLFAMPAGFVQRFGRAASDFYYSGTFEAAGYKIGYIRVPNYSPPSTTTALQQFEAEMAYFEQNTDGLIVDEMHNTGGSLCFGENIVARLVPYTFRATGFQIRPFWARVSSFYSSWNNAKAQRADQWIIDTYEVAYKELYQAYTENRGLTGALPICTSSLDRLPATNQDGRLLAYTKPIMMLIDEFSTSTADSVPGMFQDSGRGILFGMRTNGAGGNNIGMDAGAYSEGTTGMTIAMQARRSPVRTPEYPASELIETVGVRPDIEVDYMTRDNLLQRGKPFVDAFTDAMVSHIRKSK